MLPLDQPPRSWNDPPSTAREATVYCLNIHNFPIYPNQPAFPAEDIIHTLAYTRWRGLLRIQTENFLRLNLTFQPNVRNPERGTFYSEPSIAGGRPTTACRPNPVQGLFLQLKFFWNTATLVRLRTAYGCFPTTGAELNSCNRKPHGLHSLKCLLSGPLEKKRKKRGWQKPSEYLQKFLTAYESWFRRNSGLLN